jgi:transposase
MGLVTVYSGAQRRREWSEDEKVALVAAAFAEGAKVADIARRAEVSASLLYRWRRQLGRDAPPGFIPVAMGTMPTEAPAAPVIVVEAGKDYGDTCNNPFSLIRYLANIERWQG